MPLHRRFGTLAISSILLSLIAGCSGPPPPIRPNLPPSESDLVLLKTTAALCDRKPEVLKKVPPQTFTARPWGSGQELLYPAAHSPSHADESYFFDEDGML